MAVSVFVRATGEKFTGKFALIEGGKVGLYSGIMADRKGGRRGCGKKSTFVLAEVEVLAHQPDIEILERDASSVPAT